MFQNLNRAEPGRIFDQATINIRNLRLRTFIGFNADVLATCSGHPGVTHARVTIDKPHALRFAESVSLTFEYSPNTEYTMNLLERAS